MFTFRKLNIKDKEKLDKLIDIIEKNLTNNAYWLPMQAEARNHFFDENWTIFYGAFKDDNLISACALFLNEFEYGESAEKLNLNKSEVAEIGRCMVNPDYRGNNLMLTLNSKLLDVAKQMGKKYIIATAHPDNIPSNNSLKALGMTTQKTVVKMERYPRNIMLLEL